MFSARQTAARLCALILLACAGPAAAVDVSLRAPGASPSFTDGLRAASLVVETVQNEEATAQDVVAAARADYARMVAYLYEAGYYGGVVSIRIDGREADSISPIAAPSRIGRVDLVVRPGPAFAFGRAEVRPLTGETTLPEGFATGQIARATLIGQAAREGRDGWRRAGHAKADIEDQSISVDHRRKTLDAAIRIDPGPRLRFGNLNVEGQSTVRPGRVRAIAGLPTGQVYSPAALETAGQRLRRTGAFRSVVLEESDTIGPGQPLDIGATLVDAKPRRFGFGLELSSLEGLTVSGFWLHRNLLGGAERLRIEGEVGGIGGDSGGIDYRLSTRFERPATFTPETTLILGFTLQELDEPDFRERSVRLGGGLEHIFSDTLTGEIGLAYLYSDIDDDLGSRSLEHVLLPAHMTYDSRDKPLDARSGLYTRVELAPFVGFGGGGSGARLYADARAYLTFPQAARVTWAARTQVGSVTGAGLDEVPPAMLFFSGGADTVRGQPFQSLAVELGGGNRVGGRSFMAVSAEMRASLSDSWGFAAFADAGFVGQDSWGTSNGDWQAGAGLGVRYQTGIGPIRVDLATPLDSDAGEDFELYIGIGQAF